VRYRRASLSAKGRAVVSVPYDVEPEDADREHQAELAKKFALADEIIEAGFNVLPAWAWPGPDGTLKKAPGLAHGHLDAHRDRQRSRQELANPYRPASVPPEAEVVVGFVPGSGGCGVLDCDIKNDKCGKQSYEKLRAEHGPFVGAAWKSPSGGVNILFRKPEGATYGNHSPWLSIDVRSDGGWAVSPGSNCTYGSWRWVQGGFGTAMLLPEAMTAQLRPAGHHGQRASDADTVAFIEASPEQSADVSLQRFEQELHDFGHAQQGSRHDALKHIIGWAFGMETLDLRYALARVKVTWAALTAGEGRADEVDDLATWTAGQEIPKRRAEANGHAQAVGKTTAARKPQTLAELLDHDDEEYDWLVPGLLERGDRLMLTGKEGEGKSTLLRQIGICAAAGLHPFTFGPIDPLKVLLIDCENSFRQLRREFTKALLPLAPQQRADMTQRFFVEVKTEGLVLNVAKHPDGDRAWLEDMVKSGNPELVILGPIYKVIEGNPLDEEPNRELVKFLDRLRITYGFAVLLEAHTPHDQQRPYGWSGWKRWPEFGLHLDANGELSRWRGDRDARAWPERLIKGGEGDWLWQASVVAAAPSDPYEAKVISAQVAVLAAVGRARKPLTRQEVLDRAGRQRLIAIAAFSRLRDRGAFLVTPEGRSDAMGRSREVELFEVDPDGPFAPTK
jgi:hypothetical protein